MRLRRIAWVFALAPLGFLAGCFPEIHSDQPLGIEIAVLDAEHLNGVWLHRGPSAPEGAAFRARVLDAQTGVVAFEEPCKAPSAEPAQKMAVWSWRRSSVSKTCGGCAFYFAQEAKESGTGTNDAYATLFTVLSDGKSFAALYLVDPGVENRLLWLVAKGALPGHLKFRSPDSPVVLAPLSPRHYEVLLSVESRLFAWHAPMMFLKLPDELDPCKTPMPSQPESR